MPQRTLDDLSGAFAPVLNPLLLTRVHELNLDYVELLIAQCVAPESGAQLEFLPLRLPETLRTLDANACSALARASFTLFSLGFEDHEFWRTATASMSRPALNARYATEPTVRLQSSFCELALLHAWHVAATSFTAARLLYSMPESTAALLLSTPLWQLRRIANDHPGVLMPRWPTNPRFWPDLVRFAVEGDARRLETAQLLGAQLIAAELEAASAADRRVKSPAALRSPHLRARRLRMDARIRPNG
jgi:hypothetical protein